LGSLYASIRYERGHIARVLKSGVYTQNHPTNERVLRACPILLNLV